MIVATGGAATPLVMAASSGLIGGGLSLGISGAIDYKDNGQIDGTFKEYAGTYAGGFVTGALLPGGSGLTLGKQALVTGLASSAGSMVRQSIATGEVDYGQVALEGVTGAAFHYGVGVVSRAASPYIAKGIQGIKNGFGKLVNGTRQVLAEEGGYIKFGNVGKGAGSGGNVLYHSADPSAVKPIIQNGFRTDLPSATQAFHNNRFGRGVYLADSPATALAERPGTVLRVQADLGKNLNVANRGIIDYDMGQAIARGARKHGFDSITFNSARNAGGINTVIFDPLRILGVSR